MAEVHIAVVDDEPDIRETMREYLQLRGYRVSCADGGDAVRELFAEDPADLVLLDISMPGEDGLSIARYLRDNFNPAIIMVTAAGEVVDRIVGLEMGADDYLPKPVDLRELLARIKAVLRRASADSASAEAELAAHEVQFGQCVLNLDAHQLTDAQGEIISITAMEFDLLKAFAENAGRVLSRDRLLEIAHSRDWEPFDRSIDIRVARLRRKVERNPSKPQVIKTVRGAGYVFSPEGSVEG
ncbi:MAG: response regulator [Gammaproteobacteria bacterium]|nr:response regulator [Gammaproteobacteria bacterium]